MSVIESVAEFFGGEVKIIQTLPFRDDRGFLSIPFRCDEFKALGLPTDFVQHNHSRSRKNVIRGLHFQLQPPMGKLMRVSRGLAYLVTVDIRQDSPTFLKHAGLYVSEINQLQVWAPAGFARGFCALEDNTEVQYQCTGMFHPFGDSTILWNDPAIGIKWPVTDPIVSEKDRNALTAAEVFNVSR
jgi:dTDP-4-dehydrorhamnose 3,5-epimerase